MRYRKFIKGALLTTFAAIGMAISPSANATLLNFNLAWSGASFLNSATATGTLTFDDSVLLNPGSIIGSAATVGITSFTITIAGASSGNGTFGLPSDGFIWNTGGGTLDLSQELVGQATLSGTWGIDSGQFNYLNVSAGLTQTDPFVITTAFNSGDSLRLTSFAPQASKSGPQVPEPGMLGLFGVGLVGLGFMRRRRKAA